MMKKFRIFATLSVFICLLGYSYGVFATPLIPAIQSGADHIRTIQNADGSFTWPHGPSTAGPGHANITGPIGMG